MLNLQQRQNNFLDAQFQKEKKNVSMSSKNTRNYPSSHEKYKAMYLCVYKLTVGEKTRE